MKNIKYLDTTALKKYFEIETVMLMDQTQVKLREPISSHDVNTQYNEGSIIKSGYNSLEQATAPAGSNVTNTAIWHV